MLQVDDAQIARAVREAFVDTRAVLEPAGAIALAGLSKYCRERPGAARNYVAVASDASNIEFEFLSRVGTSGEAIVSMES